MNRRYCAFVLMAIGMAGLLAVAAAPAAAADGPLLNESDLETGIEIDPETLGSVDDQVTAFDAGPDADEDTQRLVVETTDLTDGRMAFLEDHGDVQDSYENRVELELPASAIEVVEIIDEKEWVDRVREPSYAVVGTTSEGVDAIDADDIHADDVTGDDVAVGILDPTGFDVNNDEIEANVVDTYPDDGTVYNNGDNTHGTATAEVVTDVAPDSDLYLAQIETETGYANGVDWLVESDVDVIVMSAGFYGERNDGTGFISTVADNAVDNHDVVWVNAAGNDRDYHYSETFTDSAGDRWHEYGPGTNVNPLNGGAPMRFGQSVQVHLTWDDWSNTNDHYDLVLARYNDGEWTPVAESSTSHLSREPREQLSYTVLTGDIYAVAIANVGASGGHDMQLFVNSNMDGPMFSTTESSVSAPATGHHTMSVAAVNYDDNTLASYSSRGPTLDGRTGVDVAAPTRVSTTAYDRSYTGTSAAAPHVGGLAALMQDADPSLDAEETADQIRSGADAESIDFSRVDESGTSTELEYSVGSGMVDAAATVEESNQMTGANDNYIDDLRGNSGVIAGPELEQAISDFFVRDDVNGPTLELVVELFFG